MDIFQTVYDWFMGLGVQYGVNPIVFGSIYVGAIPLFSLSIGWLIKNYRQEKSIVLPSLSATFFFISAYLYLMIAGQNVPWWVYAVVVGLVVYGAWSTYRKVKSQIKEKEKEKSNG